MGNRKCELCGELVKTPTGDAIAAHECPHGVACEYRPYTHGIRCKHCHKRHPERKEWERRNREAKRKLSA